METYRRKYILFLVAFGVSLGADFEKDSNNSLIEFYGNSKSKINTFVSVFPTSKPKFVLAVMLDEPKTSKDYIYHYRDGSNIKYKGTPFNTAGWTTVEATGQIVEKIGPILATKYSEIN